MADKEQLLHDLLNKIAVEHNYDNSEISFKPISSGGANYTSQLYSATVKQTGKDDLHLFAKIAAMGESFRENVTEKVYKTEVFVYTNLMKKFKLLEEENGVPDEHRITFSKYYGSYLEYLKEIIVLEDLVSSGYESYNRFNSVDWNYASTAVRELAKIHALSYAYREKFTEDYCKIAEETRVDSGSADHMKAFVENSLKSAFTEVDPEHRGRLMKALNEETLKNLVPNLNGARCPTLIHADFRPSNLLHKVREDGSLDIKVVDLQTIREGSPIIDLLYFIVTGTDEEFRSQYYEKLLNHYYSNLSDAMKRLNLNPEEIYSREDFDIELKQKLPDCLILGVFTLPIVTVEVQNAPVVDNLKADDFYVKNTSELYKQRLNGLVRDYIKWGIL